MKANAHRGGSLSRRPEPGNHDPLPRLFPRRLGDNLPSTTTTESLFLFVIVVVGILVVVAGIAWLKRTQPQESERKLNLLDADRRHKRAENLQAEGNYAEAEVEHRAVLAIRQRVLGPEHPDVAQSCYNLAQCLKAQNKCPEALAFARQALEIWTKKLGADYSFTKDAKKLVAELEPAQ